MNVAPELEAHLRPVDDLLLLPGNPRQGDIAGIAASLERFGQQKPIVVDTDGVIIAGNHTYQAAVHLGWTHVAAVTTTLQGTERAGFALADNRLSDLATYDDAALLELIRAADSLEGTGYDYDDIDDLLAYAQETDLPVDGTTDNPTIAEREARREALRALGMEVRSLVFLLTADQFEWAISHLQARKAANNTEAFLDLLADTTGEEPPEG